MYLDTGDPTLHMVDVEDHLEVNVPELMTSARSAFSIHFPSINTVPPPILIIEADVSEADEKNWFNRKQNWSIK